MKVVKAPSSSCFVTISLNLETTFKVVKQFTLIMIKVIEEVIISEEKERELTTAKRRP